MTTQELIEKTKQLMAIQSTSDNPDGLHAAVDFVADIVAQHPGITIERFEQNGKPSFLAYRGDKRPERFDILLNSHIDVVPAKPEQYKAIIKDGRLYGRGALDMKGTALALTDAFCELVNEVPYLLGLQIVSDEEIGGYNGTRLHIEKSIGAEFAVIGEYANHRNTIYNAARGLCWAEIAFKGKEAHGGHLWHGDNAVVKAGNFAGAVLKRFPTPNKETWATTASVASLSTPNDTFNKVPDHAILKIDFRFTQEDPVFQNEDSVRAFIASIDPHAELVNMSVFEPAVNVAELNPYCQGLGAAIRKTTGAKPQFYGRPGGSDGRHYALANIDIVEFGLYGQGSHSDEEYVELSSFEEYTQIIRRFLENPKISKPHMQPSESLQYKLLRRLVEIPSVSGNFMHNNNALMVIEDFLRKRGMYVEQFEHNGFRSIVATTQPGNKQPTVLLNAHVDVVPGPEELFTLHAKGDKLSGRGVMDMKFAIASYLAAVDALQDNLDAYDFGIMITSDEEIGSENGTIKLLQEHGYKPGVAVIPDSGEGWKLETFAKGVHWIKLIAKGKPGHASRQWEGDSAIRHLLDAISEIEPLIPPTAQPTETTMSVGTIEGGSTANQIPTHASAVLDIRYGSVEDYDKLYPQIRAICKKHGVTTEVLAAGAPSVNDPDNEYIKPIRQIVAEVTGTHCDTSLSYGVTDGRHFSAIGVPCVVIQPPAGNRHKDTEWLSKKGFDQFCVVIEEYLKQVAVIPSKASKEKDIISLAERLDGSKKPAYVWYATFGSGLSKGVFTQAIIGGSPEGAKRSYAGCRDKTLPVKDMFVSLPHELYFTGRSISWSGGLGVLDIHRSTKAHTISRAYLITIEQFEDIAAQENLLEPPLQLPLSKAMREGHAPIKDPNQTPEIYEEVIYCGEYGGIPMFSLTSARPREPYAPPNKDYTIHLCQGLAEDPNLTTEALVDYVANTPGIEGYYDKAYVAMMANQSSRQSNTKP